MCVRLGAEPLVSESVTGREMGLLRADCCSAGRPASKPTHAQEGARGEHDLDRGRAEAVLQPGLTVPGNYAHCQICQETDLAMSREGAGRGQGGGGGPVTKRATHLPLALSAPCAPLKTIKGSQPPLRSRRDGDYENNNCLKNYLHVLREL